MLAALVSGVLLSAGRPRLHALERLAKQVAQAVSLRLRDNSVVARSWGPTRRYDLNSSDRPGQEWAFQGSGGNFRSRLR
jgi:hypothetical protein